jgi:hypothetical protein
MCWKAAVARPEIDNYRRDEEGGDAKVINLFGVSPSSSQNAWMSGPVLVKYLIPASPEGTYLKLQAAAGR